MTNWKAQAEALAEALVSICQTATDAINAGDWVVDGACDPGGDFMFADRALTTFHKAKEEE